MSNSGNELKAAELRRAADTANLAGDVTTADKLREVAHDLVWYETVIQAVEELIAKLKVDIAKQYAMKAEADYEDDGSIEGLECLLRTAERDLATMTFDLTLLDDEIPL